MWSRYSASFTDEHLCLDSTGHQWANTAIMKMNSDEYHHNAVKKLADIILGMYIGTAKEAASRCAVSREMRRTHVDRVHEPVISVLHTRCTW